MIHIFKVTINNVNIMVNLYFCLYEMEVLRLKGKRTNSGQRFPLSTAAQN